MKDKLLYLMFHGMFERCLKLIPSTCILGKELEIGYGNTDTRSVHV